MLLSPSCEVFGVSVGAPTWRGLKRGAPWESITDTSSVSRCPDMEGIETLPCIF